MVKWNPFQFRYQFQFDNGHIKDYRVALDHETLSMIPMASVSDPPEWVRLAYRPCSGCPLDPDIYDYCPIAVNIMDLVESFKKVFSYHDCTVVCETAERTYSKKTSVMEGLSAIFGVIMATSDCPVMEFLKPMARFHLPFATLEETTLRTTSMYLLAQYFKNSNKPEMKIDFKALGNYYSKVQLVNEGLLGRINSVGSEDADKNALVILHSLSQFLSMEIGYSLSGLEHIFSGRFPD
jgi:hypothetical protein